MLANLITAVRRWRESRHTLEMLARLSDDQLRDIGLNRIDLEAVVRGSDRT